MADELSEQDLDAMATRAQLAVDAVIHLDQDGAAILKGFNTIVARLRESDWGPALANGPCDVVRLVAEVRRLRDELGGVEYRPGALGFFVGHPRAALSAGAANLPACAGAHGLCAQ
jgi:hypothetical protein